MIHIKYEGELLCEKGYPRIVKPHPWSIYFYGDLNIRKFVLCQPNFRNPPLPSCLSSSYLSAMICPLSNIELINYVKELFSFGNSLSLCDCIILFH